MRDFAKEPDLRHLRQRLSEIPAEDTERRDFVARLIREVEQIQHDSSPRDVASSFSSARMKP